MVVIAYYYYAESASAELIPLHVEVHGSYSESLRRSSKKSNVLCVRPSRRTKGLSLNASNISISYFHISIRFVMLWYCVRSRGCVNAGRAVPSGGVVTAVWMYSP